MRLYSGEGLNINANNSLHIVQMKQATHMFSVSIFIVQFWVLGRGKNSLVEMLSYPVMVRLINNILSFTIIIWSNFIITVDQLAQFPYTFG